MNKAKKAAVRFRKKYGLYRITYDSLKKAAKELGYSVILFGGSAADEDVDELIDALGVSKFAEGSKGFTYADKNYRLIFIHSGLSENERCVVLSHELGHVVCKHLGHSPVIGNDVAEEKEANDFSFYLLNPGFFQKVVIAFHEHKKRAIIISVAAVLVLFITAGLSYSAYESQFYGKYYVTSTGYKYHLKSCKYIKNKRNIKRFTKKQKELGSYSPCEVCLPNE